jgi:YbbR domain-containing protein
MIGVLRGLLFDNLGLKLVALLMALLVYLNVYTDRPASMTVSFPIQIEDLGDSLSLAGPRPAPVHVALKGTGKQLLRVRLTEPPIKISLDGVGPGRYQRTLAAADLPITIDGPQVEHIIGPRMIELQIERRVHRSVPVAARVNGVPASGFEWSGTVVAQPMSLVVTGPRSTIVSLDSVQLRPVSIGGRRDTLDTPVEPVALPDWCSADPPLVRLRVPVRRSSP